MNAKLNITINGQNGDLPDLVNFDASDADLRQMAQEAVASGSVPGITADAHVDFTDSVVDRFPASDVRPYPAVMIRPKTAFGA